MAIQKEGAEHSTAVIDSNKFYCSYCGGTRIQASKLGMDPDNVEHNDTWTDLGLTNAKNQSCSVALCHCGQLMITRIELFDTAIAGADNTPGLTDLDSSVTNSLTGWWWCILTGTEIYNYVRIETNDIAAPTSCVLAFNIQADADGVVMITNVEPVGWTKIVA